MDFAALRAELKVDKSAFAVNSREKELDTLIPAIFLYVRSDTFSINFLSLIASGKSRQRRAQRSVIKVFPSNRREEASRNSRVAARREREDNSLTSCVMSRMKEIIT